ncbi:MAG: DUF3352 domain-containing protein [Leptolyngbya sp. SIO4C1]|nr:DUF3352 domain-containing protein [Leptolyngbya sp. SIO4C1]
MTLSKSLRWQLSFRTFATLLGTAAALIALAGLAGFWQLMAQSPLLLLRGSPHSVSQAAAFVPRQAPLMVSLLTSPERLIALRQVLTSPAQRRDTQAAQAQLKASFLEQTGLDYDRDIRPWIGDEVTLAVTDRDFDRDPTNGRQPAYLAAIALRDGDRAREFLELFWQRQALAGAKLQFEVINGVRLIYEQSDAAISTESAAAGVAQALAGLRQQGQLASAVVGDRFLLLANHPQAVRQSIRNAQAGSLSLSQRPDYQRALKTLPSERIGLLYCNLPQFLDWLGLATRATELTTTPQVQSLTAAVALSPQGLRLKTAIAPAATAQFKPHSPTLIEPVPALRYLPQTASFAAGGQSLAQLWQTLETQLQPYKTAPAPLQTLRQTLTAPANDRLLSRLKRWLTGDYAVGQWSSAAGAAPDWILVTRHTEAADEALTALDRAAEAQQLTVSPLLLQNQPVTTWSQFQTRTQGRGRDRETTVETQIKGLHATVAGYDILTTSLAAMSAVLTAPSRSLLDSPRFQQTTAVFEQPNDGYLYVDWPQLRPALVETAPWLTLLDTTAQPLLETLQTIAVSSYGSSTTQQQGDILVQLTSR